MASGEASPQPRCEPGASAQRYLPAFPAEPAMPMSVRGLKRGWFCTRACEQGQGEGLAACRAVLGEKTPSLQVSGTQRRREERDLGAVGPNSIPAQHNFGQGEKSSLGDAQALIWVSLGSVERSRLLLRQERASPRRDPGDD